MEQTRPGKTARAGLVVGIVFSLLTAGALPAMADTAGVVPLTRVMPTAKKAAVRVTSSVVVKQVTRAKVRSTVKVAVAAPKKAKTVKVTVKANPSGTVAKTGKTLTRSAKATWSKGAYRATVTLTTKAAGSVAVSARVAAKTYRASTRKAVKPASKITGWTGGTRKLAAGASETRTLTVAPAWGRKVAVQEHIAGKWVTRRTLTTKPSASAKVKVTVAAPATTGAVRRSWRVLVPATVQATSKATSTLRLEREAATPTPTPTPTPKPTPKPTAKPIYPDGDHLVVDTGRSGADCNAFVGQHPGGEPFDCGTAAVSNVSGRFYRDARCGVTMSCWRKPIDEVERWCTVPTTPWDVERYKDPWYLQWLCATGWDPPDAYVHAQGAKYEARQPAPYVETHEPLYMADLLAEFNQCRTKGCFDDNGDWHASHGSLPFKAMPVSSSVQVTTATGSRQTLTIPGQGAHAQEWAAHLFERCVQWNEALNDRNPCSGSWVHGGWNETLPSLPGDFSNIMRRGKARIETAINTPGSTGYVPAPAGKRWRNVGEIHASGPVGRPRTSTPAWMASPGHSGAILQEDWHLDGSRAQTYVLIGAVRSPAGYGNEVVQFFVLEDV